MRSRILAGLYLQHTLAEEECERIAEFVVRDLQDTLVDREQHGFGGMGRMQAEGGHLAGLDQFRRIDGQRIAPRVHVHRERRHAVTQRTHEDFVG
jgi:hypothetical protein